MGKLVRALEGKRQSQKFYLGTFCKSFGFESQMFWCFKPVKLILVGFKPSLHLISGKFSYLSTEPFNKVNETFGKGLGKRLYDTRIIPYSPLNYCT